MAFDYFNSGMLIMDSFRGGLVAKGEGESLNRLGKDRDLRVDGNIKAVYEDGKISCTNVPSSRLNSDE
jgi:hypothetical protein